MPSTVDAGGWGIPEDWRAPHGALTPAGHAAQFRTAPHAVMAARIHYLCEHPRLGVESVDDVIDRYQSAWSVFAVNCREVVTVANFVDNDDLTAAADVWNSIDQPAVHNAFAIVMGEGEPFTDETGRRVNLSHIACEKYLPENPVENVPRDRRLNDTDRNDAWDRAGGLCVSCRNPTTRTSQHQGLFRVFRSNSDRFNLRPSYINTNDDEKPLWSERILIAAKGSPDHVIAASRGGFTTPDNLANTCAACQFARGNRTLDDLSVPAYGPH